MIIFYCQLFYGSTFFNRSINEDEQNKTKTKTENKLEKVLSLYLGEKTLIWLAEFNKYLIVNPPIDKIIELIYRGENEKSIFEYCVDTLNLSIKETKQTLQLVKNNLNIIAGDKKIVENKVFSKLKTPKFQCKRHYRINKIVFFIEYESPEIEYLVHPKFAHLEITETSEINNHFQLFEFENEIILLVDGETIGSWKKEQEHFMTGKVSMQILQKIHGNKEKDWMAVFHAAGISNGKYGIMFLGDSGNGKSTLSAILLANGFEVLADDFLPVESNTSKLCSFPAAISVKNHAIDLLAAKFQELKNTQEYSYPILSKTVRYLSIPNSTNELPKKVPCKALVFVKYKANSAIQFSNLSKDIAFQKLVPDSWISPLKKNAKQFLNWFNDLPCYQLTYSENEKMVKTALKIFNDDL